MGAATTYGIRVGGHLDDHWVDWLGCAELRRDPDGSTTVLVAAVDQAQLHGVLASLRDLGAELLEVWVADPA